MNWMLMLLKNNAEALSMVDGDGHTLYSPEYLIKKGYPIEFIKSITYRHESDYSNGKSTIFDPQGNPIDSLLAVAALTFHYAVANELKLIETEDYEAYNGRGTQARAIAEAIRKLVAQDV